MEYKLNYTETDVDLMATFQRPGKVYWALLTLLVLLVLAGAVAWLNQIQTGIGLAGKNSPVGWAMYITTFVFWVGIAHSGTLISAILFLVRVRWRAAVYRSAEAVTVFAVMTAGLFPFIHLGRVWVAHWIMPVPNFGGLWPNFRSPLAWDVLAISTYFTVSSTFFIMGMLPDLAIVRDKVTGWRKKVVRRAVTRLAGDRPAVEAFHGGLSFPGGARHAAGDFRAQHRVLGFCHEHRPGLAQYDLCPVLRCRRDSFRPGNGCVAAHPDPEVFPSGAVHHDASFREPGEVHHLHRSGGRLGVRHRALHRLVQQ